uniref:Uncharacterized protein n=1 Tax=Eutreptiella gymnastica TaxID=73025 RepID=A0A7S1JAF9_9EUGL
MSVKPKLIVFRFFPPSPFPLPPLLLRHPHATSLEGPSMLAGPFSQTCTQMPRNQNGNQGGCMTTHREVPLTLHLLTAASRETTLVQSHPGMRRIAHNMSTGRRAEGGLDIGGIAM